MKSFSKAIQQRTLRGERACLDLNSYHTGSSTEKKECGDDLIILFKEKCMLLARGCDSEVYTWFKLHLVVLRQGRLIDTCLLIKLTHLQRFIAVVLVSELQ